MIRNRYNKIPHYAPDTSRERDTNSLGGIKRKAKKALPTDGHQANILNNKMFLCIYGENRLQHAPVHVNIVLKDIKNASPCVYSFLVNGMKNRADTCYIIIYVEIRWNQKFISNCRVNSDDVMTLVKQISNEFINRRFMISIWILLTMCLLW